MMLHTMVRFRQRDQCSFSYVGIFLSSFSFFKFSFIEVELMNKIVRQRVHRRDLIYLYIVKRFFPSS